MATTARKSHGTINRKNETERHGRIGGTDTSAVRTRRRDESYRKSERPRRGTPQPQNRNCGNGRYTHKSTVFGHGNFHRTGKRNVGKTIFGRMSAHLLVDFVFEVQEIRIVFD